MLPKVLRWRVCGKRCLSTGSVRLLSTAAGGGRGESEETALFSRLHSLSPTTPPALLSQV